VVTERFTVETPAGPIAGSAAGSGTPLLLLHGGPGLTDYMGMLDPELTGWRAIRYQQRGMSPSATDGPFTVERNVADAIAVLDTLGVSRAVVLGHSWGGHLALHLALTAPERVAGLVSVDALGAVGDGGATDMDQGLGARLAPDKAERYAEIAARLAAPSPTEDDATEWLSLLWPGYFADTADVIPFPPDLRMSLPVYAGTFESIAGHMASGFTAVLAGVKVPSVFVLGAKSPMPVSQGEQTAALLPAAEVVVVPGAGHLPWHEQPGCIAAALTRIRTLADLS
jgi:pimeloyl-ACP methyl ester carboxylesterase